LKGSYDLLVRYWRPDEESSRSLHEELLHLLDDKNELDASGEKDGLEQFRLHEGIICDRWAVPDEEFDSQIANREHRPVRRHLFNSEPGDRLRLERSFILVRVPLPPAHLGRWPRQLSRVFESLEAYGPIIESIAVNAPEPEGGGEGLVLLELLTTCASRGQLSQLNRELERDFALVNAQKSNLTCYDYHEHLGEVAAGEVDGAGE
jgi:hypothetical protein